MQLFSIIFPDILDQVWDAFLTFNYKVHTDIVS